MKRFSPHVLIVNVFMIFMSITITAAFAQPTASFTADKTSGCAPLVVTFDNQSTGATSYEWHTGISTTTLSHPTVLYSTAGTYPVMLIAIDAQGQRDTLVESSYITVYASPVADFSVSAVNACVHAPVSFTDLSQTGSGSISQWTWDFGDGTTSSLSSPTHAYTNGGQYPVSLQVTDAFGCTHSVLKQNLISINAPETGFSASQTVACGTPLTVAFTPLQSSGLTHEWIFGNGNTSTLSSPTETYQSLGSFDVMHIAEDVSGCRDSLLKPSYINIGTNTLIAFAKDSSVCDGDSVHFSALAPPTSTVTWDYGDGNSASGLQAGHVYNTHGSYTVTVDIVDQGGCQVTRQIPIQVYETPVADFTIKDTNIGCEIPFTVEFINLSTGASKYTWMLYDGPASKLSGTNPTWTYTSVDSFTVRLIALSADGCKDEKKINDYIKIRPPEPGFESDNNEGCAPFTVQFTDTTKSFYPIVDWQWDFGDGNTGTGMVANHTYTSTGVFDVQLIVTTSQGCQDTITTENMIEVGTKPTANFIADTLQACALSDVNFINMSTNATSFVWYFGDGDTAMSVNPTHGFAALGPMDVVLIADNQGCKDTLIRPMYIDVLAPLPVIGMTGRYLCNTPETVQFINLSLGADTWEWTLPDGTQSLDSTVSYQFTQNGSFPVSLKVSNLSTGCMVEITDSVYVKPIVASFTATPTAGCTPLTVTFNEQSKGAIEWNWDFGNGQTSSLKDPVYTFTSNAYHQVSLTVENYYGCKDTQVLDSIRTTKVWADIVTNSPTTGCAPLTVDFRDASREFGSTTLSWLWDFGDGTISTLQHPSHTFIQPGTYTVKLTVTNDLGCSSTRIFHKEILASDPQVGFQLQPMVSCPGAPVSFLSTSTGSGLSYQWDFGDNGTSVLANPSHAYASTGFYDVSLTITDAYGCSKSETQSNAVQISELNAEFVADTTQANCPPLEVHFTANDQYPHQGLFFQWDFGNGATGNTSHPTHVFTQPGNYDIQLVVGTPNGCRDTLVRPAYINIEGPSASFVYDPGEGCPGTNIEFEAVSPDTVSYKWIYGDGSVGSGATSSHIYNTSGTYLPVLVIEDTAGCTVFSYARDPIEIFTPPTAAFSPDHAALCDSATISFQDLSNGNIQGWSWNFGDGTVSSQENPSHHFGTPGNYQVSLTVSDDHGCRDSISVSDAVMIHPSPDLSIMGDLSGDCAPVSRALEGSTNGHPAVIQQWQWTSGAQQATGKTWTPSFIQAGIHSITLEATDQFGCSGSIVDYLEVYPNPVADFRVDDSLSCAPVSLQFTDLSAGQPVRWAWTLGDGGISQSMHPSHQYLQDGTYSIGLVVENIYGCRDSLVKEDYLQLSRPVADFTVNDVNGCPGTVFTFQDLSQSGRPLISRTWNLGDSTIIGGVTLSHQFLESGTYPVSLIISDDEGCTDTVDLDTPIEVEQDAPAVPMQTDLATVISDREVSIQYQAYDNRRNDFGQYLIYRSDNGTQYQVVGTVSDMNTTSFTDRQLDTRNQQYWYKVVPENTCANEADWDSIRAHKTILLTAWPGLDEATLVWSHYQGWDQVDKYRIYRVTGYEPTDQIFLGEVTGEDSVFTDADFRCDENYAYRVTAIHNDLVAGSDSSFTDPLHLGPDDPTHTIRATVENSSSVLVEWEDPRIDLAERVVVERSSGGQFRVIAEQPWTPGAVKVSDTDVAVTNTSYTYRIVTIDSCGDATPFGRPGTTILLSANREFTGTRLAWTPYQGWESGVEGYTIEVYDESTQSFITVAQLGGHVTEFYDDQTELDQPDYCYRVTAWEYGGNKATSQSNEACVQPEPYLYLASAFSPNGDGFNDVFQVGASFVGNIHLEVFNRWGKRLYAANSQEVGWDGYTQDGYPAPEGVYVINIKATGYNGTIIHRAITVTLMR